MHRQGPVRRLLLIEHVPYAVQPGCRLNEALSVCEPSWNLPARTPAVISLYLWEKPKMKTCLVQNSSLPGPTRGICCFWTTEIAEGLLFLPRNPSSGVASTFEGWWSKRWRNYVCTSDAHWAWSCGKLHFYMLFPGWKQIFKLILFLIISQKFHSCVFSIINNGQISCNSVYLFWPIASFTTYS